MQNTEIKELANCCEICSSEINSIIELPDLPVTGIYSKTGPDPNIKNFNQELMLCSKCGHGQLRYSVNPGYLYGSTYGFRTSLSDTASKGSIFFSQYLKKLFPNKKFKRIVEFGCNDAYLLRKIHDCGEKILGVDPIWNEKKCELKEKNIQVIGGMIEDVDFQARLGGHPDLVLSQHTMEHVEHPGELLTTLVRLSADDAVFVFEFPCFDQLLEKYRFDQVFHQHLQYYSVQSFITLLNKLNLELIDFTFNYTYWGAMLVAFKKNKNNKKIENTVDLNKYPIKNIQAIKQRYSVFRHQMELCKTVLASLNNEKLYGYGGALMLPILGYHLENDFSEFRAILDDDNRKNSLGYVNLPVKIQKPDGLDFSELSICLTALDNRRPILKHLESKMPKHIINPLNII